MQHQKQTAAAAAAVSATQLVGDETRIAPHRNPHPEIYLSHIPFK